MEYKLTRLSKHLLLLLLLFNFSCSKDNDDNLVELSNELEISDFVWKGLNDFYYWQADVPNLGDNIIENQKTYTDFISKNSDPDSFFDILLFSKDRFSWIVDDYVTHENSLQGIVASNGMEFGLTRQCDGCEKLVAYVKYVHPNSDAYSKNILRGDFFTIVNGSNLTISNYRNLLYGDKLSYTITLSSFSNGNFSPTGRDISLTKKENFEKNPVHIFKTIDSGSHKIGYLMYNQFVKNFDSELNTVFSEFKTNGITDLVLDLRYNRGGSISSCIVLSSLITGQFNGQVFSKQNWNSKLNKYWNDKDPDSLVDYFIPALDNGMALNSLNLQRLYVLTTNESASASELLINSLKSYIEVIQIGDTTTGKNVGSITIYDWIDNDNNKNPNHKYAMQPIVLAIENSAGFSDYTDGLKPDHGIKESITKLGILGSPGETLFSKALSLINGNSRLFLIQDDFIEYRIIDPELIEEHGLFLDNFDLRLPEK